MFAPMMAAPSRVSLPLLSGRLARKEARAGGRPTPRVPYLARPFRLVDLATILRVAGDELGRDADGDDPPRFGEPAMLDWLAGDGAGLLLWLALRRDHPGLTPARAERIARESTDEEIAAVARAGFRRAPRPGEGPSGGHELATMDWDAILFSYFRSGAPPEVLAGLSLDQADAIASAGKGADARAAANADAWQDEWERAAAAGAATSGGTPPAPTTVEDLGYQFAPGEAGTDGPTLPGLIFGGDDDGGR